MALLGAWARAGKDSGAVMIAQLSHGGRQSNSMINTSPVGPGNVRLEMPTFNAPRPLTTQECEDVVNRFAHAAAVCEEAGFDGIQVHAAHGYLLSSFLNPRANNREECVGKGDRYGGSLENRARILLDTVKAVRSKVGSGFLVSVKLNSADFQHGGLTVEDAAKVVTWLDELGVDLTELSGGNYESNIYESMTDSDTTTATEKVSELMTEEERREVWGKTFTERHRGGGDNKDIASGSDAKRASTVKREAYFLEYAKEVRRALEDSRKKRGAPTDSPAMQLMVTGGWRSRRAMAEAIRAGDCALIGVGRPLCGDPACTRKLLDGSEAELPAYERTLVVVSGGWLHQVISSFSRLPCFRSRGFLPCSHLSSCDNTRDRKGPWWFNWIFRWIPIRILGIVHTLATQSWYYRQLYTMGQGKEPDAGIGPIAALIANRRHEEMKARSLLGGVDCVGMVYAGPKDGGREGGKAAL